MVKDDFLELLVDFIQIAKDHDPLALDCVVFEFGVLKDVGEDVDRGGDVGVE